MDTEEPQVEGSETTNQYRGSIGDYLRRLREQKQISREEVASALQLSADNIIALEKDRFLEFPSHTYVTGYYRAYARQLGISDEKILSILPSLNGNEPNLVPERQDIRSLYDLRKLLLGGFLTIILLGLIISFSIWAYRSTTPDTSKSAVSNTSSESVVNVSNSLSTAANAESELSLEVTEPGWVQVADASGHYLIQEVMIAGQQLNLKGRPPFQVSLSNADGVLIRYNGAPFDHRPYSSGDRAVFQVGAE